MAEKATTTIESQTVNVPVQGKAIRRNQVTALHLMIGLLLFMMGVVTWIVPSEVKTEHYVFLDSVGITLTALGLGLIVLSIFFNKRIIQKPRPNSVLRLMEMGALGLILVYTLSQKWYLPFSYSLAALILIVFAYWWERRVVLGRVIQLREKDILIPGFFRNTYLPWQDVVNLVMKYGVLTINCHNNRIYQFDLNTNAKLAADVGLVTNFGAKKIEEYKDVPRDDW